MFQNIEQQRFDPLIATAVAAGLTAVYLCWTWLKRKLEAKKPFEELPMAPNSHWLKGHIGLREAKGDFRLQHKILMEENANEYGQAGYCKCATDSNKFPALFWPIPNTL